jgi:hypothetical protein
MPAWRGLGVRQRNWLSNMQVLFDGDVVVYRAGFAAEKTHYTVAHDGALHDFTKKSEANGYIDRNQGAELVKVEQVVEPVENAIYNAKSIITSALKPLGANEEDLVVVLSGPTNFRNGIAVTKPYKGNRDASHKPVHGPEILAYIKKRFKCVESVDEEADDVLGYLHYDRWEADSYGTVICTIDKDLDMIPGLHYNFRDESMYYVDPLEADRNFWKQMLTGDTVDNIPGVPGWGPKKAASLLSHDNGINFTRVKECYQKAYGEQEWEQKMLEMGRLLWIRRTPDQWWTLPKFGNSSEPSVQRSLEPQKSSPTQAT